jgi:low temperature requirement protein LtrA
MNFTWFSSAYDTDDVIYRLLTVVQMGGVLVLAAGVPRAFDEADFGVVTLGYVIMRLGLVGQWVRAAVEHPERRRTALRFATGVFVVQLGWVARLWVPEEWAMPTFLALVVLELAVPIWAESAGMTPWHPHHIAERFGLFVIILLGESVLAATVGVRTALAAGGVSPQLVAIAIAGLVTLVGIWWLYFLEPTGDGLARHRGRGFYWGYGHYPLFAAIAATGAGLEVAVEAVSHHLEVTDQAAAVAVALPVAIVLAFVWVLHRPIVGADGAPGTILLPAAALVAVAPLLVGGMGLATVVVAIAVLVAVVVVASVALLGRVSAAA